MSKYDKASLVMIPSAYKAEKLYSILPENGNGDFTHDRNTTATRVNKDGLIETVAADVPRLDYPLIDGVVQDCPALLLEPSRTNLITYSEDFANAYWTLINASIVSNVGVAPDGTTTADRLVPDTSLAATHLIYKTSQAITGRCYSIFAKADGFNWLLLTSHSSSAPTARGTFFDLENGVVGQIGTGQTAWMEDYGNGWWKCSIDAGTASSSIYSAFCCEADDEIFIAAPNGTNGIQIWGAENQDGLYPTSYIPTLGTAVTRNADVVSKTGISSLIGQTEGTLFVEFSVEELEPSLAYLMVSNLTDGTASNRMGFARAPSGGIHVYVVTGNTSQFTFNTTQTTGNFKLALAYKANDFKVYLNGVNVHTNTSALVPISMSRFDLNNINGNYPSKNKVAQALLFKTRLSNAELAQLTTI